MLTRYRPLARGEFIVIGCDTSAGAGDYCAAQFVSKNKIDVPWVYHTKKAATEMTTDLHPILDEIFDMTGVRPVIAYERNNGGAFEMERLAALNRAGKFELFKMPQAVGNVHSSEAVKYGWDTNTASRPAMLQQLKEAVDKKVIRLYDKKTIEEMYAFVVVQTSSAWKAQAEKGAHDDLVMSLAIAWQLYQMCQPQQAVRSQQVQRIFTQLANEEF